MKKILYISPSSNPFVVQYGGAQRSNLLLQACRQIGEVDVICFENIPNDLKYDGINILYGRCLPVERAKQSRIRKLFDLFVAWHPQGQIAIDAARERVIDEFVSKQHYEYIVTRYMHEAISMGLYKYADRLVVDIDDSPVEKAHNGIKLAKTIRQKVYMTLYTKLTEIAMQIFLDKIAVSFFSNKHDADTYRSVFLPNIPFYTPVGDKIKRDKIKRGRLLFVGDLTYSPNYTGLEHFLTSIYPRINRKIEMHIVGRIPDEEKRNKWNAIKGVSVLGFVEDLMQEYAEAEVIIIPIYFGAGTCIKVLEAMQMQRVLVTTPIGIRGYEEFVSSGQDYLLAHDDSEFVKLIQNAIDNCSIQEKITTSAKEKVELFFSKKNFFNIVKSAMTK